MKQYAVRVVTIVSLCLGVGLAVLTLMQVGQVQACLLYTSDAADE